MPSNIRVSTWSRARAGLAKEGVLRARDADGDALVTLVAQAAEVLPDGSTRAWSPRTAARMQREKAVATASLTGARGLSASPVPGMHPSSRGSTPSNGGTPPERVLAPWEKVRRRLTLLAASPPLRIRFIFLLPLCSSSRRRRRCLSPATNPRLSAAQVLEEQKVRQIEEGATEAELRDTVATSMQVSCCSRCYSSSSCCSH